MTRRSRSRRSAWSCASTSARPYAPRAFVGATEPAQQLAPRRVEVAVVVEPEALDDVEPGLRTLRLRHCDGPVQLDDRRIGEASQLAVERGDLGPVAGSSACNDAIAACTMYGPRPRRASARSRTARPSTISSLSSSE